MKMIQKCTAAVALVLLLLLPAAAQDAPQPPPAPADRGGAPGGEAPGGGRGGARAPGSKKLGDGVYLITCGYRSVTVTVEFKDHIVLIEAPQKEMTTANIIAEAKKAISNKPIKYVVHWIPIYNFYWVFKCSELFHTVLRKKHQAVTEKHRARPKNPRPRPISLQL